MQPDGVIQPGLREQRRAQGTDLADRELLDLREERLELVSV